MDYTYDDDGNMVDPNATADSPEYVSSTPPQQAKQPPTSLFHGAAYQQMGNTSPNGQLLYTSSPLLPQILSLTRGPYSGN